MNRGERAVRFLEVAGDEGGNRSLVLGVEIVQAALGVGQERDHAAGKRIVCEIKFDLDEAHYGQLVFAACLDVHTRQIQPRRDSPHNTSQQQKVNEMAKASEDNFGSAIQEVKAVS